MLKSLVQSNQTHKEFFSTMGTRQLYTFSSIARERLNEMEQGVVAGDERHNAYLKRALELFERAQWGQDCSIGGPLKVESYENLRSANGIFRESLIYCGLAVLEYVLCEMTIVELELQGSNPSELEEHLKTRAMWKDILDVSEQTLIAVENKNQEANSSYLWRIQGGMFIAWAASCSLEENETFNSSFLESVAAIWRQEGDTLLRSAAYRLRYSDSPSTLVSHARHRGLYLVPLMFHKQRCAQQAQQALEASQPELQEEWLAIQSTYSAAASSFEALNTRPYSLDDLAGPPRTVLYSTVAPLDSERSRLVTQGFAEWNKGWLLEQALCWQGSSQEEKEEVVSELKVDTSSWALNRLRARLLLRRLNAASSLANPSVGSSPSLDHDGATPSLLETSMDIGDESVGSTTPTTIPTTTPTTTLITPTTTTTTTTPITPTTIPTTTPITPTTTTTTTTPAVSDRGMGGTPIVTDEDVRAVRGHYEKIIAMATHAISYTKIMAERRNALVPGQGTVAAGLRKGEGSVLGVTPLATSCLFAMAEARLRGEVETEAAMGDVVTICEEAMCLSERAVVYFNKGRELKDTDKEGAEKNDRWGYSAEDGASLKLNSALLQHRINEVRAELKMLSLSHPEGEETESAVAHERALQFLLSARADYDEASGAYFGKFPWAHTDKKKIAVAKIGRAEVTLLHDKAVSRSNEGSVSRCATLLERYDELEHCATLFQIAATPMCRKYHLAAFFRLHDAINRLWDDYALTSTGGPIRTVAQGGGRTLLQEAEHKHQAFVANTLAAEYAQVLEDMGNAAGDGDEERATRALLEEAVAQAEKAAKMCEFGNEQKAVLILRAVEEKAGHLLHQHLQLK